MLCNDACYFRKIHKGYTKCSIVYMGIAISAILMLIKPKYLFLQGGRLPQNSRWLYNGHEIEMLSSFNYLEVVFSSGGVIQESYKYSCW